MIWRLLSLIALALGLGIGSGHAQAPKVNCKSVPNPTPPPSHLFECEIVVRMYYDSSGLGGGPQKTLMKLLKAELSVQKVYLRAMRWERDSAGQWALISPVAATARLTFDSAGAATGGLDVRVPDRPRNP